jgi:hypothetical protein
MNQLAQRLLLLAALAVCTRAHASADVTAVVSAHLRARGASAVTEVARGFLVEGQSAAHAVRLERSGCAGYLALGLGEVRDVDLGLYSRAGQLVAEDVAIAPFAYARVCGEAGLELYASASLYAGRGQLLLLRVDDAPRELGRLPASIPLAVSAGGRLEDLRAVGSGSDELTAESSLLQEERAQQAVGYSLASPPLALELRAGSARGQLLLRAGRCYRLAALVPRSRGVAIEVEGPSAERWSTRSNDDRVALAFCAPTDAVYPIRLQARPLRGVALLRAFEHKSVDPARVRELGEASAMALAEAEYVARSRGFALAPLGHAWVENSAPLVWPLTLPSAGCYALAVVSEVGAAAVDVRLIDANGVMIAHNEGRRGVPMVFTCPREPGPVRLVLKARGPDLRVTLWLGKPEGMP